MHVYPNLILAIHMLVICAYENTAHSFNPSSNDLLVPKIQHLRAVVPRPEILFVTRGKKSFINEMGRSHRNVTKIP
jgi:hypothetical protein